MAGLKRYQTKQSSSRSRAGSRRPSTRPSSLAQRARTRTVSVAPAPPVLAPVSTASGRGPIDQKPLFQPEDLDDEENAEGNDAGTTNNGAEGEPENIPVSQKVILCITSWMGKMGCCYYDPAERKLFLIEDTTDSAKFDLALNIVDQVNPHLTLVSNRADEALVEGIKAKLSQSASEFVPTVEIRANREFQASAGRIYLLNLPVVNDGPDFESNEDDDNDDDDERHGYNGQGSREGSEEVINVGQEGLRNAYNFMKLRKKRMPRTPGNNFISSLRLGGSVSMESDRSLETIACLFSYLNRRRNAEGFGDVDGGLDVASIEMIHMNKAMMVNSDTLASLQIFENEAHANIHSQDHKEGLSLYSLLNRARTPMGKTLLRRWLLQPSLEIPVLDARLDAVECFSMVDNTHMAESIHKALMIKNIPQVIQSLLSGHTPVNQWQALSSFIAACICTRDLFDSLQSSKEVQVLNKFSDAFELGLFEELQSMIDKKIDWPESKAQHRVCILEGVDGRLDDNRNAYNGLPSMLSRVAAHLSKSIDPSFCTSLNVVYFPQLGYLCAVPLPDEFPNPEMDHATPIGWQYQFSTEVSVYYKNQEMRDLDTHLGDLHGYIVDREVELVQEMLEKVVVVQGVLCECAEILAELDVLLAFADATRQHEWTRPHVTDSNVVRIDQGRHPLVELCVDHFVRNDAQFVGGRGISVSRLREIESKPDIKALKAQERELRRAAVRNGELSIEEAQEADERDAAELAEEEEDLLSPDDSLLILTGANASGKSVFLKTVALIVYMAHIGCFVPAERAVIGLTDKIMTRMNSRESVSRGSSAFMIDLQQISFMLRNCTARSLLLVDEFGKGTNSSDGAGLFVGLIKYLITREQNLPKVLLATHFHEIFVNKGFLKKNLPIGLAHMELIVDRAVGGSGGVNTRHGEREEGKVLGVTPLFRLAPGLCLKSYAFHCAESYGIPSHIVSRALAVSTALSSFSVHEIMDPEMTPEDDAELRNSEEIVRRMLGMNWGTDEDDEGNELGTEGAGRRRTTMERLAEVLGEEYREEE